MTALRIGIAGINGRLGRLCAEEIEARGLVLTGGLSRTADPARRITDDAAALARGCDVVIDVSHPDAIAHHARVFAEAGCGWVLGTTGLDDMAQTAVLAVATTIPVLQAANFAPGLTMLLDLARQLGAALPAGAYDAEIVETHHRQKLDAPSGTALAIGAAVSEGRGVSLADVKRVDRTGRRQDGEIGFASLRAGQIVGEHSLILTSATEQITLSHRAFDRRVFADGAVQAACWLAGRQPGLYGMRDVLGLTRGA
ncbi:4-hydroxy-tetrahydrodipicolinate reductase [Acidomonas methanolica]|uniref:4-hydroxy-tetrahydrodipicolinate reductase n=1 Tax=Acidomonas methanolica NBRC 104435 TaxID=1231351 RepID=A0A023D4K6_ACIMT|nr:4-hydroxy-tetrahydrodipicolinate reductase [Acidomonas methanolica]MBU2653256.1 4-hydroxy-tetrahydrodipicolinate reductase [Acidomonas methanolica]TCS32205.1 dihydrodipicolinate reductase [Acidomonas methanolica]GAJ29009.1 dihydrodipicolinate reductase [Acidomonas methanolica NBRC 104435]GBQ50970.1 dihydrodipicolinate reductase [Acidomonas methanolica]GEK97639.1 4-hydroxy-tetrahydrodipicolinate reductase [Acidomonas methanolica NBRC 104435]